MAPRRRPPPSSSSSREKSSALKGPSENLSRQDLIQKLYVMLEENFQQKEWRIVLQCAQLLSRLEGFFYSHSFSKKNGEKKQNEILSLSPEIMQKLIEQLESELHHDEKKPTSGEI